MRCSFFVMSVTAVLMAGCEKPEWSMGPPKKPRPAPELAKLERMIGTWSGTAEIVSPSPEEMKKMMPEGAEEMPSTFAGGNEARWSLDGMFLRQEGWHEMGEGQRATYLEFITWDPKVKKYHNWYFSDWGESGEGWMTADSDGSTFHIKTTGKDANGDSKRGKGSFTFVNDDTMTWEWSETGPKGKMKLKGTSKRKY